MSGRHALPKAREGTGSESQTSKRQTWTDLPDAVCAANRQSLSRTRGVHFQTGVSSLLALTLRRWPHGHPHTSSPETRQPRPGGRHWDFLSKGGKRASHRPCGAHLEHSRTEPRKQASTSEGSCGWACAGRGGDVCPRGRCRPRLSCGRQTAPLCREHEGWSTKTVRPVSAAVTGRTGQGRQGSWAQGTVEGSREDARVGRAATTALTCPRPIAAATLF